LPSHLLLSHFCAIRVEISLAEFTTFVLQEYCNEIFIFYFDCICMPSMAIAGVHLLTILTFRNLLSE
jgi:hypothetical protein